MAFFPAHQEIVIEATMTLLTEMACAIREEAAPVLQAPKRDAANRLKKTFQSPALSLHTDSVSLVVVVICFLCVHA